jgi:hypothetical protein
MFFIIIDLIVLQNISVDGCTNIFNFVEFSIDRVIFITKEAQQADFLWIWPVTYPSPRAWDWNNYPARIVRQSWLTKIKILMVPCF